MAWGSRLVAIALFVLLLVAGPLGRIRFAAFRRRLATDPQARLRFYWRAIVRQYAFAVVGVWLYATDLQDGYRLPVLSVDGLPARYGLVVVLGAAIGSLLARRKLADRTRWAKLERRLRRSADLLPHTAMERRVWVAVSITAGVAEELLYRAFLMGAVGSAIPGARAVGVTLASAGLFGLAHLYQGRRGVIATTVLGVVQSVVALTAGLVPAIALHAIFDLRLLALPPELIVNASELGRSDA